MTFLQRRCTKSSEAHEKILNIFSHRRWKSKPPGFPGGSVVKSLPANAGDKGSIPDMGRCHIPWSS